MHYKAAQICCLLPFWEGQVLEKEDFSASTGCTGFYWEGTILFLLQQLRQVGVTLRSLTEDWSPKAQAQHLATLSDVFIPDILILEHGVCITAEVSYI